MSSIYGGTDCNVSLIGKSIHLMAIDATAPMLMRIIRNARDVARESVQN